MTILRKYLEIANVASMVNADAIIHGGDMFDIPRVSPDFVGQLANMIKLSKVPWYVVPGNHDMYGHTVDTINQTMLGLLGTTDVINILSRKTPINIYDDVYHFNISLQGQEYYAQIDTGAQDDYGIIYDPTCAYHILVAHGMLLDQPFGFGIAHTVISDLKTDADMILVGHYHPGFPVQTIGKTTVINPGSMARVNAGAGDNRDPQYVIIDITNQGIRYSLYPFKTAKPANQILDYVSKFQSKLTKNNLTQFKSLLQSTLTVSKALDIHTVLNDIAADPNNTVDAQLVTDTLAALGQTQASKDDSVPKLDGFVETQNKIWISKIEAKNFQSHKNLDIDLSPGLNVIKGESNSGKSSIFRLINWVQMGEPKGADMISSWAKDVWGKITYNNGYSIERQRTKKDSGFVNIYDATGALVSTFKGVKDNPIDIINIHQMPPIWLTKDDKRNITASNQLETSFLVTESAGLRASSIGRLTGLENVDATIRVLNADTKSLNKEINIHEETIKREASKLSMFNNLPMLQSRINEMQMAIDMLRAVEKEMNDIISMQTSLDVISVDINRLEQRIKLGKTLPDIKDIEQAQLLAEQIELLKNIKTDNMFTKQEIINTQSRIQRRSLLSGVNDKLVAAELVIQTITDLKNIKIELQYSEESIIIIKANIESNKLIPQVEPLMNQAEQLYHDIQTYLDISYDYFKTCSDAHNTNNNIKVTQRVLERINTEMDHLIESGECMCPMCGQPIIDNTILQGGSL